MIYWSTANALLPHLYPARRWKVPTTAKKIYLSFDDGPHPAITPFVLDQLKQYDAKATFFCIGKNVQQNQAVYNRILAEGHAAGNHTMHHLNGWKSSDSQYLDDIRKAETQINTKLFRPPYGKLKGSQAKALKQLGWEIIMWTVLSGDFDRSKSATQCWDIVRKNSGPGSILVFHDSEKAKERLLKVLPLALAHFSSEGYTFERLGMSSWA